MLALRHGWICSGSSLFCLALNYKQMSLYHALPFFFYILGPRYNSWRGFREIVQVGVVVILTFAACWLPFISEADHVIMRMFPFNRGLFEDKVATFWCSLSVVVKVRDMFERVTLVRAALFITLIAVLPSQILLFRKATSQKFLLALTNSALGFFLFSFHVHEKTILIPLTTVVLLLCANEHTNKQTDRKHSNSQSVKHTNKQPDKHSNTQPVKQSNIQPVKQSNTQTNKQSNTQTNKHPSISLPVAWFILIATFSMHPLLLRDGLGVMYVAGTGLFLSLLHVILRNQENNKSLLLLFWLSVLGCLVLHLVEVAVPPPERYPFLYPTLNALYSAAHFAAFFCYFNYLQIAD